MNFKILSISGSDKMHAGQLIHYKVSPLPLLRLKWVTEITNAEAPHQFTDEQKSGPFKLWRHTHTFTSVEGGVQMSDTVDYAIPMGILGRLAHRLFVRREVNAIFDYRYQVLEKYFDKIGANAIPVTQA